MQGEDADLLAEGRTTRDAAPLTPIDQTKLRESVYAALCDAFTRGAYAPGEVLSLRELAAQLGTSMTPVREAVRRLVAEGALVDTPSRTLAVPEAGRARVEELKSVRLSLELQLLDWAMDLTGHGRTSLVSGLRAILATPGRRDGRPDLRLNHAFHFTLYEAAPSVVALPLVRGLWLQYGALLRLVVEEAAAAEMAEHAHHAEIVAALEAGNRRAARAALREDIDRSFKLLKGTV